MTTTTKYVWGIIIIALVIAGLVWAANRDDYQTPLSPVATTTPAGATTTPGAGGIMLLPAEQAARSALALKLGITDDKITAISVDERDWPDACLGVATTGTICAQVITPGYQITMHAEGTTYVYRTNSSGSVVVLTK